MKTLIVTLSCLLVGTRAVSALGQQFSFDPSLTQSRFFSNTISMDAGFQFSDGSGVFDHEAKQLLVPAYQDASGIHDWGLGVSTFPIASGDIAPAANGFATLD